MQPFTVKAVEYTRDVWDAYNPERQERAFKPGVLVTSRGEEHMVPDIKYDQYLEARNKAPCGENGILAVDLAPIQIANRNDHSLISHMRNANYYPGMCYAIQ